MSTVERVAGWEVQYKYGARWRCYQRIANPDTARAVRASIDLYETRILPVWIVITYRPWGNGRTRRYERSERRELEP